MGTMRRRSVQANLRCRGTRVDKNMIAREPKIRKPLKIITAACQLTCSDNGHGDGLTPGTKDKNLTRNIKP